MKLKQIVACSALMAVSGAALADGFRGSVGAMSEYLFRGIEGSAGAAVQGELYYAWDGGYYAGAWMTNARAASNKTDIYAGYEGKFGELALGGGAVYRLYSEDREHGTLNPKGEELDYAELFATAGLGPLTFTAYVTHDYFGTSENGVYLTGDATLVYNDTVSFIFQAGFNAGEGVKIMRGEEFTDYSATLEKRLEGDLTATFQIADTDREFTSTIKDDPKFLIGLRKDFAL